MAQRVELESVMSEGYKAVIRLEQYVQSRVDHDLLELLKLRASMINGCAFCVDMHSTDLLGAGEDVRRVVAVSAWRESPFFTEPERVALELTDAVTRLGEHGVPDDLWVRVTDAFGDVGGFDLVFAIATINVWNRLAIANHSAPPALAS
jgi:AhpD family alkylhydroperoxidase